MDKPDINKRLAAWARSVIEPPSGNFARPYAPIAIRPAKSAWKTWLKRGVITGVVLAGVIHLYGVLLIVMPVPTTANMILSSDTVERDWVPIERISPNIVRAVIVAEDSRFCAHNGIDWDAVEKAQHYNERQAERGTGKRRGGSTITQQTAKNVYLWNGGGMARKALEAYFSYYIDTIWTKRRIMEVYLNIAEWGDGIYGVEMAAQTRFRKPAKDLSAREAALLASVLPSPNKWRVDPPGPYVQKRSGTVLARMGEVKAQGLDACVLSVK